MDLIWPSRGNIEVGAAPFAMRLFWLLPAAINLFGQGGSQYQSMNPYGRFADSTSIEHSIGVGLIQMAPGDTTVWVSPSAQTMLMIPRKKAAPSLDKSGHIKS